MDPTTVTSMLASYAEKAAEAISNLATTYGPDAINLAFGSAVRNRLTSASADA